MSFDIQELLGISLPVEAILWGFVLVAIVIILAVLIWLALRNPYRYPYYAIDLDVSHRRNVQIQNEIEQYLIDYGIGEFSQHHDYVEQWKRDSYRRAGRSLFKSWRVRQLQRVIDDDMTFVFNLRRDQTRYTQKNYVKSAHIVSVVGESDACGYDYILERYEALQRIGFETTTSKYDAQDQRRLMTPELRERIKLRDNYTCQICGKYMPDEVGLHIDHIVPVSKGGKTVPSNLQVLCSKCNGRKSDKL